MNALKVFGDYKTEGQVIFYPCPNSLCVPRPLIIEAWQSHSDTSQSLGLTWTVISLTQRPLTDKTQHSQGTDLQGPSAIETAVPASERPQTHASDRVATVIGGKVISTVNYADDVVLVTKEDTVVQGMLNRLTEIGRSYGMENNVKQRWCESQTTVPSTDHDRSKQQKNMVYCNCLISFMTNDARCTREIKSRITIVKATFNKQTLFISKLDLNWRKKLEKFCIWGSALCGAETWTLRKVDQIYLKRYDM